MAIHLTSVTRKGIQKAIMRNQTLEIRCTVQEITQIREAAHAENATVSAWVRRAILQAHKTAAATARLSAETPRIETLPQTAQAPTSRRAIAGQTSSHWNEIMKGEIAPKPTDTVVIEFEKFLQGMKERKAAAISAALH